MFFNIVNLQYHLYQKRLKVSAKRSSSTWDVRFTWGKTGIENETSHPITIFCNRHQIPDAFRTQLPSDHPPPRNQPTRSQRLRHINPLMTQIFLHPQKTLVSEGKKEFYSSAIFVGSPPLFCIRRKPKGFRRKRGILFLRKRRRIYFLQSSSDFVLESNLTGRKF